jgi:hypothetical protein
MLMQSMSIGTLVLSPFKECPDFEILNRDVKS